MARMAKLRIEVDVDEHDRVILTVYENEILVRENIMVASAAMALGQRLQSAYEAVIERKNQRLEEKIGRKVHMSVIGRH